jgi:hypothetical protein
LKKEYKLDKISPSRFGDFDRKYGEYIGYKVYALCCWKKYLELYPETRSEIKVCREPFGYIIRYMNEKRKNKTHPNSDA